MELNQKISEQISSLVKELFDIEVDVELTIPDAKFGDFSTNVAMQLAGQLNQNPREIAESITAKLIENDTKAEIAGPGFINIHVSAGNLEAVINQIVATGENYGKNILYQGKVVVAEYSDMNAFKTAHAGHLYTTLVGDAIANLYEYAGAMVKRTNFGGDVGLHVGKAMWGIINTLAPDSMDEKTAHGELAKMSETPLQSRMTWIAEQYVRGTDAYETYEQQKSQIIDYGKRVYGLHDNGDTASDFAKIYWTCRTWSYDGFEKLYEQLELTKQKDSNHYFTYYPESETAPIGLKIVQDGLAKGVFEFSDGAVVYKGEKDGLHTRVFLNSLGLPTYETKDLGLAVKKWDDFHFDLSVVITANEIAEYMKVVQAALHNFYPEITDRSKHITHGMVKLVGGKKMSSRKGTVVLPEEVLNAAREAALNENGKEPDHHTVLAAVKYAFLKQRIGGDIIYDAEESVATVGNSGPYLQYAHARACSILGKSAQSPAATYSLHTEERGLVSKLSEYPVVIIQATEELTPHHLCSYLYELAGIFNSFYEKYRVIGDAREAERLTLIKAYCQVLRNGLKILGIFAPEKM